MNRHALALAALLLALPVLIHSPDVSGGKKPKPPPEPASPTIAWESRGDLWVADADGANATKLLESATPWHPSWSPDGRSIAYIENGRALRRIDVELVGGVPRATDPVTVVTFPNLITSSRWSPRGDEILFVDESIPNRLLAVPAAGGDLTTLYVGNQASDSVGVGPATWSSDGSRIAFLVDSPTGSGSYVKILDRATRTVTKRLGPIHGCGWTSGLDWARTLDVIAYEASIDGSWRIVSLDLATGLPTIVCDGRWPSWAPDDSGLVHIGDLGKNRQGLAVRDLATGTDTLLLRDRYARFPDRRQ